MKADEIKRQETVEQLNIMYDVLKQLREHKSTSKKEISFSASYILTNVLLQWSELVRVKVMENNLLEKPYSVQDYEITLIKLQKLFILYTDKYIGIYHEPKSPIINYDDIMVKRDMVFDHLKNGSKKHNPATIAINIQDMDKLMNNEPTLSQDGSVPTEHKTNNQGTNIKVTINNETSPSQPQASSRPPITVDEAGYLMIGISVVIAIAALCAAAHKVGQKETMNFVDKVISSRSQALSRIL